MTLTLTKEQEQQRENTEAIEAWTAEQTRLGQWEAHRAAQRLAEQAAADLESRIDALKASVPSLDTIHAPLDALRAQIPELQRAVLQRHQAVTAAITDAHSTTSPRVQLGPNGSWAVIDRQRISTHSLEIGTEVAALCAELCRAAGEAYLEQACRARVRGGNRLPKGI